MGDHDADFRLGEWVRIHGTVKKVRTSDHWTSFRTDYEAVAGPPSDWTGPGPGPREYTVGVVVGKRTLQTGTTHVPPYSDDAAVFKADGAVTVWIVAHHLHRKPVQCFGGQLERLGD